MHDRYGLISTSRGRIAVRWTMACGDDGDAESGPRPFCYPSVRQLRWTDTGRPVDARLLAVPGYGVNTEFGDEVDQHLELLLS